MADERLLRETEEFFYDKIPITRAMGVRVTKYDGDHLRLAAPIALNHNHLGTAFGGSLSALAILAAYGLIWLEIGDKTAHVVIRKSELSFRRPVRREIVAICRRPSEDELWMFKNAFAQIDVQLTRRHDLLTHGLIAASGRPGLRRRLVPAARAAPWLFRLAVNEVARPA